jgi:hypothetical protein
MRQGDLSTEAAGLDQSRGSASGQRYGDRRRAPPVKRHPELGQLVARDLGAADPLRASGEHPAHRRLRPPPKPRLPSAVRMHLVRCAAAAALRRLALEPPPRRIENARVRLCKRNRQHP